MRNQCIVLDPNPKRGKPRPFRTVDGILHPRGNTLEAIRAFLEMDRTLGGRLIA